MSTHWALHLAHVLYASFVAITAWLHGRKPRKAELLKAQRRKVPKHLCLNLVADDEMPIEETENAFLQCLKNVSSWCRILGIETLTVYDRRGIVYGCSEIAYHRVFGAMETAEDSCESEVEYPLTPPLSESSSSRSYSPEHMTHPVDLNTFMMVDLSGPRKYRKVAVRKQPKSLPSKTGNLTVRIASRASGKPAIVSASRSLLQAYVGGTTISSDMVPREPYCLTVSHLATVLEASLPPPDFMIIHHIGSMKVPCPPIEFHGFPPWQITLTEFHRTHPDSGDCNSSRFGTSGAPEWISEAAFCRALDEYAGAEFRLGK